MMWDAHATRSCHGQGTVIMGHGLEQLASDGARRLADERANGRTAKIVINAKHVISSARRCASWQRASTRCRIPRCNASNLNYRDFLTVALMVKVGRSVPGQLDLHP